MCGILGVIGAKPDYNWLNQELTHLRHRGPDSEGLLTVNDLLVVGSTRLAMTDLMPRSNQPMKNSTTGSCIVFNGEIYNYKKLRQELIQIGISFTTDSDTEVLLKGLDKYGSSFLQRVNGMYAFAYFNPSDNNVVLGRDSLGKKPLYYLNVNSKIYFSSSQNSLQKLQNQFSLDENSLISYLTLGYVFDPNTMHEKIKSMQPGHILVTSPQTPTKIKLQRIYEDPKYFDNGSLADTLKLAVESRISGHSEIGISLSGGYDSTLIAILLSKIGVKVRSYTAIWNDSDKEKYNLDSKSAKVTSKNLGFEHSEVEIFNSSQLRYMLRKYLTVLEEPNNNSTGLSMLDIYGAAKQDELRLMLTGDGADEFLAGYLRYEKIAKIPNLMKSKSSLFDDFVLNHSSSRVSKLIATQLSPKNNSKWLPWHLVFSPSELSEFIPRIKEKQASRAIRNMLASTVRYSADEDLVNFMEFDQQTWLTMESNKRLDRVSMSFSIEARSPFQDSFFTHATRREMSSRKRGTFKRELLRKNFEELMNFEFPREKAGFISPIGHWLRSNPKLISDTVNFLIDRQGFAKTPLLKLSSSPWEGQFSNLVKLWTLIVYSEWIQISEA